MYVVVRHPKSVGIAILLTLLFGPLGLFYASVIGGFIMTFSPLALLVYLLLSQSGFAVLAFISGMLAYVLLGWIICIVWAILSVNTYNRNLLMNSAPNTEFGSDISDNQNLETESVGRKVGKELTEIGASILWGVLIVGALIYFFVWKNDRDAKNKSQWSTQNSAPLYLSPNIKSQVVTEIVNGQDIEVTGETKYFRKVKVDINGNSINGYILKSKTAQNF